MFLLEKQKTPAEPGCALHIFSDASGAWRHKTPAAVSHTQTTTGFHKCQIHSLFVALLVFSVPDGK